MAITTPADIDGFLPLEGTRVLDFSKILAGPLCTQYLGDMGADVVKAESCTGGDDTRAWPLFENGDGTIFLPVNRNKRSLPVDLKSKQGLAICERLTKQADVVVESFSPGVADRLDIGYERLKELNPRIVYYSLSGYGILGALLQRERSGHGVKLEASLFDSAVSFLGYFLQGFWQRGTEPKRVGAGHESLCPY